MDGRVFVTSALGATATQVQLPRSSGDVTVLLAPSRNEFNDFGVRSSVDLFLLVGQERVSHLKGKLLLSRKQSSVVESDVSAVIRQLLGTVSSPQYHPLGLFFKNFNFVSVLNDSREYQRLIDLAGLEVTREVLRELHDVGFLSSFDAENEGLQWFQLRPEYGQSLLRSDATFLAVLDLSSQLAGASSSNRAGPERVVVLAPFLERGQIEFTFPDDALGHNRICVLVGENGTGKTRILRGLAAQTSGLSNADDDSGPTVLWVPSPLDDQVDLNSAPRLRVREHPATERGWRALTVDLAALLRSSDRRNLRVLTRAVEKFFAVENLALPVRSGVTGLDLPIQSVDGTTYVSVSEPMSAFEGRRAAFFGSIDWSRPPVFLVDGEVRRLSSGERALLGMTCVLLREIPNRGLVLLDEPELSLHPRMIAELMRMLGFVLDAKDAYCVIATHSLYVVRECPATSVHVLKAHQSPSGEVVVDYEPMLPTLGAGLTELSSVIFDDWSIQEHFERRIDQFLSEGRTVEEIVSAKARLGEAGRAALQDALHARAKSQ